MTQPNRQAMSGIIVVALIIGVSVALASSLCIFGADWMETMMSVDSIDIQSIAIKNTNTDSYISATVKNSGNSDITSLSIVVYDGETKLDSHDFSPSSIKTGITTSVIGVLTDTDGTKKHPIDSGKTVLVEISATVSNGGKITETRTVRVT